MAQVPTKGTSKIFIALAISAIVVVAVVAAVYAVGYLPITQQTQSKQLTDDLGRTVTLTKTPQKIVSLAPSATEILFYVGVGDKVVGVGSYDDYPPEVENITRLGDAYTGWNYEKIATLKPDLIVMDRFLDLSGAALSKLESLGLTIPILILYPKTLDDVLADIELVGKTVGVEAYASARVAELKSRVSAVVEKVEGIPQDQRPTVFYTFYDTWSNAYWTTGFDTYTDDLIGKAGGINLANAKSGFFIMNLEVVQFFNASVIIVSESPGFPTGGYEQVMSEPLLSNIAAVKTGRVYKVSSDTTERSGPRMVQGLEALAKSLYPNLFP